MSSEYKHLSDNNETDLPSLVSSTKLWFCAAPFFEPVVYFLPTASAAYITKNSHLDVEPSDQSAEQHPASTMHTVKIYDCDGAQINEVEVSFQTDRLGWIEIEPLIASCKFESGVKHGCLEICSQGNFEHKFGLLGEGQPLLVNPAKIMVKNSGDFFPVYYRQNRKTYLGVSNLSGQEVTIKTKLMDSQRAPEVELKIPAHAARILSICDVFADTMLADSREDPLSYLRCTIKSEGQVAYTLLDVDEGKNKLSFNF